MHPQPVLDSLIHLSRELLLKPLCPICQQDVLTHKETSKACSQCQQQLRLTHCGIEGDLPLPWKALGFYRGALRNLLLRCRKDSDKSILRALAKFLNPLLPNETLLIPIPSWKSKGNLTPLIIAQAMDFDSCNLLKRARPTIGQHRLNQVLRHSNQHNSFKVACNEAANITNWNHHQAWIVDDILTTGATAIAAKKALVKYNIPVAGLICLARTPAKE